MMLWSLFTAAISLAVVLSILFARSEKKAEQMEHMLRMELSVYQASRESLQIAYKEVATQRDFYREDNLNMHRRYDGVECLTVEARQSVYTAAQAVEARIIEDLATELVKQIRPHIFVMRGTDVTTGELTYIATLSLYNKRGEGPYARQTP